MNEISLTPTQLKVLEKLVQVGEAKLSSLAIDLNLSKESLFSIIETLKSFGFLSVKEEKNVLVMLSKEGESYVKTGLPERQIVEIVYNNGGRMSIDSLHKFGIKENIIKIGLKWIVEKHWGEIKGGQIVVSKIPEIGEDEKFLQYFKTRGFIIASEVPEKVLHQLTKRKLLEIKEEKDCIVSLTQLGRAYYEKLTKIEVHLPEATILSSRDIVSGKWKTLKLKKYNLYAKPKEYHGGSIHPYIELEERIREILIGMGFEESDGPFLEPEFWVFDVLFQRQNHPARELFDTYRVKDVSISLKSFSNLETVRRIHESVYNEPWSEEIASRIVLRGQTTCVSARFLFERKKPPIRMFVISDVFRSDVIDATHHIQFKQIEGIMGNYDVRFKHLLGVLDEFYKKVGFLAIKFIPSYFPFTEPSVEILAKHEKLGWIEMGGAGMFRPEVLEAVGVDFPVAAWGLGFDRLAMILLDINDIRKLRTLNLSELRGD